MDIETYASELACVLHLVNNGRLGRGVDTKAIGWGSAAHKAALQQVIKQCGEVMKGIIEQENEEAAARDPGGELLSMMGHNPAEEDPDRHPRA